MCVIFGIFTNAHSGKAWAKKLQRISEISSNKTSSDVENIHTSICRLFLSPVCVTTPLSKLSLWKHRDGNLEDNHKLDFQGLLHAITYDEISQFIRKRQEEQLWKHVHVGIVLKNVNLFFKAELIVSKIDVEF